ncbi:STAS domain-containing protein [Streptomyces sp. CA-132043]|uniref:STAS domain-containing protein n=1 Tax=Streptomyces sp. CA-132043 TaxID=3240048 RepID=UPI003D8BA7DE
MSWSEPAHHARFSVTMSTERTLIRIAGELDSPSVAALIHRLPGPEECAAQVVLDLSRVTFCGLAGVDLLLELYYRATDASRQLVLQAANSSVLRTVRLSRDPMAAQIVRACAAGHRLNRHPDHAVLVEALALALRITEAPLGNAQAYDRGSGALRIIGQRGFPRPFLSFFESVSDRESACGVAAQDRSPVYVEEVSNSPLFAGTAAVDVLGEVPVGAVASLPVLGPTSTVIGIVSLHHSKPSRWPYEQRRMLASLARSAGRLCSRPGA